MRGREIERGKDREWKGGREIGVRRGSGEEGKYERGERVLGGRKRRRRMKKLLLNN